MGTANDFSDRIRSMLARLGEIAGMKIRTAKISGGCQQNEIDNVHRALGYELSEEFLAYYRSVNGVSVAWACSRLGTRGGFQLPSLKKLFLADPVPLFMPDIESRPIKFLGGMDEKELRQGLRVFDAMVKDTAQPNFPGCAIFGSAGRRDPVVLFPTDAAACLVDTHPVLAKSYLEFLLATAGEVNAIDDFFAWGAGGDKELITWCQEDWNSLGDAGRYLRWRRSRPGRRTTFGPGEEALLRSGSGAARLGPRGWIELRWGANYPGPPDEYRDTGPALAMIELPGGSVLLGSALGEGGDFEQPQHMVSVAPFAMAQYPVTERRYHEVMGGWPKGFLAFQGERPPAPEAAECPVPLVTWHEAVTFCNALSLREGLPPAYRIEGAKVQWDRSSNGYRLPTESEWEYAARGGTTTRFHFGDDPQSAHEFAWLDPRRLLQRPVGRKKPNPWGVHDLWNVCEWCWDVPISYGAEAPLSALRDHRIVRGGVFGHDWRSVRSAARSSRRAKESDWNLGFRVVRSR